MPKPSSVLPALLMLILGLAGVSSAHADSVLERVKARGVVQCGGAERPGLSHELPGDRWTGLEVDICRAIAVAALGSPDKIAFYGYESPKEFDRVRKWEDDVFFLSGTEIASHKLAGSVVAGPTVFVESLRAMLPAAAPEQHLADLAGKDICYMIGDEVENVLNGYFDDLGKPWFHHAYSEQGEMEDAYGVQRCHVLAGESTRLAVARLYRGAARLDSRMLGEPLSVFPIVAATGTQDARWSAIVAWTVHTLISGERQKAKWHEGGALAMQVKAPELGLAEDWQDKVLKATGHYGDLFARNLGPGTALRLDRGPNASPAAGGLLLSPFVN